MKIATRHLITITAALTFVPALYAAPVRSAKGYQITPPPGWQVNRGGLMGTDMIIAAKPENGFSANINVLIMPTAVHETLEQIGREGDAAAGRMLSNYKAGPMRHIRLAGVEALEHTATFQQGTMGALKMVQRIALKSGHEYVFTCTARASTFSRYDAAFRAALNSTRWSR